MDVELKLIFVGTALILFSLGMLCSALADIGELLKRIDAELKARNESSKE